MLCAQKDYQCQFPVVHEIGSMLNASCVGGEGNVQVTHVLSRLIYGILMIQPDLLNVYLKC